jgi:hypothetical protein
MITSTLATPGTINATAISSSTTVVGISNAFSYVFVVLLWSDSSRYVTLAVRNACFVSDEWRLSFMSLLPAFNANHDCDY